MSKWQPIETAPREEQKPLLLLMGGEHVTVGSWSEERFAKRPIPYWKSERGFLFGINWDRRNQPTHWMPLPEPPK